MITEIENRITTSSINYDSKKALRPKFGGLHRVEK